MKRKTYGAIRCHKLRCRKTLTDNPKTALTPKLAMPSTTCRPYSNPLKFSGLATLVAIVVFSIVLTNRGPSAPFTPELRAKASTQEFRKVGVWIDNSQHYFMRGSPADEEWKALAPPVDEDGEFSSIAMIHQLQCLAAIRQEYLYHATPEVAQHCMEYIHQSILCSADTRLETVGFSKPPHVIGLPGEYVCKDWNALLPRRA
ncbi:hypothetical protein D9756_010453 [Leucocoprinus leucothites]|uniref:Uncharacterized protein n=1 Tax=Leucocoprinus leucothites TaxID=201217 RepID=A0A8H5FSS2_9AGAR|nr:hypothetical protein D9756_010453 [Leucoagaricus leucothites]